MLFFGIVISIAVISILLAYRSLRNVTKIDEVGEVEKDLKSSRVIYHDSSSVGSSSESTSS